MPFLFLLKLDRWLGNSLLYILALPVRLICFVCPPSHDKKPRHVFLKLKGGGSLMIALPALLGMRRRHPEAEFILVCAKEALIYAELTSIFDRYVVIDDRSLGSLIISGFKALGACFRANICIDLEPNSMLAAVFTMACCASRRIGLVKTDQSARRYAYTDAISFDVLAPIYIYYDQVAKMLDASVASAKDCKNALKNLLPQPSSNKTDGKSIAVAAFTSDFARERMMPSAIWGELLRQIHGDLPMTILIFGAKHNAHAANNLCTSLQNALQNCRIINLAGFGTLAEAAALMEQCDELWAVDSGLLHIARILGIPTRSFWGPTLPSQRLRPIEELVEHIHYRPFTCSPCVHRTEGPPCGGANVCMTSMAQKDPELKRVWAAKA